MQIGIQRFHHPATSGVAPARSAARLTRIALMMAALCAPAIAVAQSAYSRLGMPEVHSSLGSPLWVKIPVEATDATESVTASRFALGAPPQNAAIPFLENAEFSLERAGTRHFLVIRSRRPVNEPAVGVVVRELVQNGVRSREFVLLLDPPPLTAARIDERAAEPNGTEDATADDPLRARPVASVIVLPAIAATAPASDAQAARAKDAAQASEDAPAAKPLRTKRSRTPAAVRAIVPMREAPAASARDTEIREPRSGAKATTRRATKDALPRRGTGQPTLRLSLDVPSLATMPAASEETRAELRRRQLMLDTDDLTAALLERHHRISVLEKELVSLAARVSVAERALNVDRNVPVITTAPASESGKSATTAEPVAAAAAPAVEARKQAAVASPPPAELPARGMLSTWKVLLMALAALPIAGGVFLIARRHVRARDESFRILPQQADDYVAEVLAQTRRLPARELASATPSAIAPEAKTPVAAPAVVPASSPPPAEIHFELPATEPSSPAQDKPGIEFDLSSPAANEEGIQPPDDVRARRMRYLQSRYQDIAILKPPLDAPARLLNQAGRVHDEGAAEFAKRLLKFAAYSRPHTEEFWLALLELLYRERFVNDYLVNAKWFRQYHPQSVHWDEVTRIGYLLDPGEALYANAAMWSHEEPAAGIWLPANQPESSLLATRTHLKLELAN